MVVGDSFARDFVNMVTENYTIEDLELVYSLGLYGCVSNAQADLKGLMEAADTIVFASTPAIPVCVVDDLKWAGIHGKSIFYVGEKHFGANLNWLIRYPVEQRREARNPLLLATIGSENMSRSVIPARNFISILDAVRVGDEVIVTDEEGYPLSPDRKHLTYYGVKYIGKRVLPKSGLADLLGRLK